MLSKALSGLPTFVAVLSIICLVGLSHQIASLPLNRIIELRYCLDYYATAEPSIIWPGGYVPEHLCKIDEVQKKLGWLHGAYQTVAAATDIAVTLPIGYVADRVGARTVLLMNTVGAILLLGWILLVGYFRNAFPITAVLVGPVLAIWGGGECVFKSTTLTVLAEFAQDDTQRTKYLAYMTSINYITMFFSPAVAGLLMEKSLWLPIWAGIASAGIALSLLACLLAAPGQTLFRRDRNGKFTSGPMSRESAPLLPDANESVNTEVAIAYPQKQPFRSLVRTYCHLITSDRNFRLLLGMLFLTGFASSTSPLLIRYISKRYDWTYSKIGYLFTFKAAVNVFLLAICVPVFTANMLRKPRTTAAWADLIGMRSTLTASVLGAALIALSVNIPMLISALCVYAIGSALPVFMFALARSSAFSTSISEIESSAFSLMVLVNSIGSVVGTPIMTYLWIAAIEIQGLALGLPYFASGAVYALATIVSGLIRLD